MAISSCDFSSLSTNAAFFFFLTALNKSIWADFRASLDQLKAQPSSCVLMKQKTWLTAVIQAAFLKRFLLPHCGRVRTQDLKWLTAGVAEQVHSGKWWSGQLQKLWGSLEQGGKLAAASVWMHVLFSVLFLAQPLTPHTTLDHLLYGGFSRG